MRYRLPSLTALRAFEALGRTGSVTAAARDLQVTAGAVSRQIALLEAHFDCLLFVRQGRGLVLSARGRRYFEAIAGAFDTIDTASRRLARGGGDSQLSVQVYTTFATEWLIARLPRFRALHPGIELRLDASLRHVNFTSDEVDVGLVRSDRIPPGADCIELYRPLLFPVASPRLRDAGPPLREPADLIRHTLLYSAIQRRNWERWLEAVDAPPMDLERGLFFENSSLTYMAARGGAGIAMGQRLFLAQDLVAGRLFAPFAVSLRSTVSYLLATPARRARAPEVVAFREWLAGEIAAAEHHDAARLSHLAACAVDAPG